MKRCFLLCCLLMLIMVTALFNADAQTKLVLHSLPSLPDTEGFAGMFGGVSNGKLFCMGGANFPDKKPWDGGKKKWYDDIYMLAEGTAWVKLKQHLPAPLAYGISVSCNDKIFLIGGNDDKHYSAKVTAYKWDGTELKITTCPDLPIPIANMCGSVLNNLIVIAGGNSNPTDPALKKCFALDVDNLKAGWFELPAWPGRERMLPQCAGSKNCFFLFGGETTDMKNGERTRLILKDGFKLSVNQVRGKWTGIWKKVANMPKAISAIGNPLPVLSNGDIIFWGGVDTAIALYKDPVSHPGMNKEILIYTPDSNHWSRAGTETLVNAKVTLPVVLWNNQWVYISGEIKPAVRTNSVISISCNGKKNW